MIQSARRGVAFLSVLAASSLAVAQTSKPSAYDELGHKIEALAVSRDAAGFGALMDVDAAFKRVLGNIRNPIVLEMAAGARAGYAEMMGSLIQQFPADGKMKFLRHRRVGDEERLVIRLLSSQGLNYWDCTVEPVGPDGALRIVDLHVGVTGEPFSQTLQRMLLRMVPADGKTFTADEQKQMRDMQTFTKSARAGDARTALANFDALPERLKKEKMFHVLRVIASARVVDDPTVLDKAADEFKRRFGDDPACDLIMIDTYLSRKQFPQALASLERLDATYGGDPFLDVLRGNVNLMAGDLPAAKRFAAAAHQREPTLFEAVDSLLTIALQEKDYVEARRLIQKIEATPSYEMRFADDLNNADVFAGFKASPQYKEWLAEREQSKPRL